MQDPAFRHGARPAVPDDPPECPTQPTQVRDASLDLLEMGPAHAIHFRAVTAQIFRQFREGPDLVHPEAQLPRPADEEQPAERGLRVDAVVGAGARWRWHEARTLIPANRLGRGTGLARQGADGEGCRQG